MKLITCFELASRSTPELHALYGQVFNAVAGCQADTPERRNGFATLANIRRELASRHLDR